MAFDGGRGYGVELIHEDAVALIINGEHVVATKAGQQHIAEHICQLIVREIKLPTTISVGEAYGCELSLIHRSFIEASSAMDYRLLRGKYGVIFFEEIAAVEKSRQIYSYPIEAEMRMSQSVKQGDVSMLEEALDEIVDSMNRQNMSIYAAHCIYFDIINTVIKAVNELNMDFTFLSEECDDMIALVRSGTIEELNAKLVQVCRTICDCVAANKESKNIKLRDEITVYVNKNFKNCDLTLEAIADRFGMSSSYISRFYKDQTGQTLTEYINMLRMDAVKDMLINTEKPLKEIIEAVGYVDATSFIRKFKRIEGITPGQYRGIYTVNVDITVSQ